MKKRDTTSAPPVARQPAAPAVAAPQVRKAYSYLRFSTAEQEKGDSLRRQTARAEDYIRRSAGRLLLDTALTFKDLGVSAFRGKNLETGKLAEFRRAVEEGLVPAGSVLLVESLDRVSRQSALKAVNALNEICELGVSLVTLNDGREYTAESLESDPMSLMLAVLTFIRSNEESVTKSTRVKAAWSAKRVRAAAGETRMTSMIPAWLTTEGKDAPMRVAPERAKVVRAVFKMYAEGKGVVGITRALNVAGIPTFPAPNGTKAKHWHMSYINRLLRNPAVVGDFQPTVSEFNKATKTKRRKPTGTPIEGYYPRVVEDPLWRGVQAMLSDTRQPGRGKATKAGLQNLFGGLGTCARCGAAMKRKQISSKLVGGRKVYSYFVCSRAVVGGKGCVYVAVPYEGVEAALLDPTRAVLAEIPAGPESGDLDAQLRFAEESLSVAIEHRGKLLNLMLETGSRALSADLAAAEEEVERLQAERDNLAAKVEVAAPGPVAYRLRNLRAALAEQPLDRPKVNALMRSVFSRVVIDPDAKTATLVWKHGGESTFAFGFPSEKPPRRRPQQTKAR